MGIGANPFYIKKVYAGGARGSKRVRPRCTRDIFYNSFLAIGRAEENDPNAIFDTSFKNIALKRLEEIWISTLLHNS